MDWIWASFFSTFLHHFKRMKSSGKLEDFFPQKPFFVRTYCVLLFSWQNYNISHSIFIYRAPPKKSLRFKALLSNVKLTSSIVMMIQQMYRKKKLLQFSYFMIIPFENQLQGPTTNLVFKSTAIKQWKM